MPGFRAALNPRRAAFLPIINTILLIAIILVNTYTAVLPFLPGWSYHLQNTPAKRQALNKIVASPPQTHPTIADPNGGTNHIVIPAMLLNQPIYDGPDMRTLRRGIWRRPNTSTPDKGGNTVVAAHRFTYTNPRGVFYFLNKLAPGDKIALFWNHKKYVYTVTKAKEVAPTDVTVESPTPYNRLTLYTCTPLWYPKNRLVIISELEPNT